MIRWADDPAQRVGDDQQFHQVVIGRVRGRLDDEHILAAYVLEDFDEDLAVIEPLDPRIDQTLVNAAIQAHAASDGFGKRKVCVPSNKLGFVECRHWLRSPGSVGNVTDS